MSAQPTAASVPRVTTRSLRAMKDAGTPIVMVTAYDHPSARLAEAAGVDAVLVGDSLGMTVLGHSSTLPVTMDDMVRHTAAVSRGCERVLVVADMPFMSYRVSVEEALRNAGRLMVEGGAHAIKLEGGDFDAAMITEACVAAGVPVMGHVGLTPQSVNVFGGYRTQATDPEAAARLMEQCIELQSAGAFAIVLELVPIEIAERVSELLEIPTIGIGAGPGCDGQVQVFHDLLGLGEFVPRHARPYADAGSLIRDGLTSYAADVRRGAFPTDDNATHADPEMLAQAEIIFGETLGEDDS